VPIAIATITQIKATATITQILATMGDPMPLNDFARSTTVVINVSIKLDGAVPNITADTVTLTLKKSRRDSDGNAVIQQNANVAGGNGLAVFTLLPATTDVAPRRYFYDILWVTSGAAEYMLDSGQVKVLDRVSDV
jgi:hypothetical protein